MSFKLMAIIGAPFAVPAALLLGLALAPAGVFLWLTARPAAKLDGAPVALLYALVCTAVLAASLAWPVLAIYGANQL